MKQIRLSAAQLLGGFTDHRAGNFHTHSHLHTLAYLCSTLPPASSKGSGLVRTHRTSHMLADSPACTRTHTHSGLDFVSQYFCSSCQEKGSEMRYNAGMLSRPVDLCDLQSRYIFRCLTVSSSTDHSCCSFFLWLTFYLHYLLCLLASRYEFSFQVMSVE